MTDFSTLLNPEQCAAATAPDGPLLVLAAAGTGKTRTLVHRVAHLVERGVPADRILLLTFTNRAAREMLERAEQVVPGVSGIWSGTFHHVCARFLRRYGARLGFRPGFSILDEEDQKKLMARCVKDVVPKDGQKDFPKKELLLKMLSDAVNRGRDLETHLKSQQTKIALDPELALKVLEAYSARKRDLGAMDFDDLLLNGLRLLRDFPDVRGELQDRFLHVLVDEYQDTNALQAEFTDLLAARHRNLMVVGDDFQCIYTWRGAQFENIVRFPERWPGCRVIKLERNYRSVAPILDVANAVMKDVPHGFDKTLRPFRNEPAAPVRYYRTWDARAQADLVVSLVRRLRERGYAWTQIAVLYRSHFASIDVQMALMRANVPFRITSGVGVFEQLHVKDVLAFLRLCVDPKDELAFARLLCLLPGVGETGARKLWAKLGGAFDGTSSMDRLNLETLLPVRAKSSWQGVSEAFGAAPAHLADGRANALVEDFTRLFYREHLRLKFGVDEAEDRMHDLGEITAQLATSGNGLAGFLADVALLTNLDARGRADLPQDHVHLTTVHQAKGMEWPVVILPALVQGVFPSSRSLDDGNLDEERRLFYVAVTRARDELFLCSTKTRRTPEGAFFPVDPCVFVNELPRELYEFRDLRPSPESFGRGGWPGGGCGAPDSVRFGRSAGRRGGDAPAGGSFYTMDWRRR